MDVPVIDEDGITVYLGDSLEVLRELPDASVHAVVTDPPYGLSDLKPAIVAKAIGAWLAGDRAHVPDGRGFMGRSWDAFTPPPALWDECLRVLKPGGHLLAFAGSRTVDLMGLAIRLAGFEMRDTITWLYASGFPKSLDVSKAIDKAAGAQREVVGPSPFAARKPNGSAGVASVGLSATAGHDLTAPATDDARRWQGWGTALKPASEPIVVARKPLAGTVAQTVLSHGTGALNIDGCRVGGGTPRVINTNPGIVTGHGYGADLYEPGSHNTRTTSEGRWPSNVVLSHAATPDGEDLCGAGCMPGCPVAELDAQSGALRARGNTAPTISRKGATGVYGEYAGTVVDHGPGDTGGASRFFPTFRYQAKAPASERPRVDDTAHATVKPLDLMRWLVRLVTPPGGTALDPFLGSGTTAEACLMESKGCIGVERDAGHLSLIRKRLDKPIQFGLELGAE